MKKTWVLSYPLSASKYSDQGDLSLRWAQNHFVGFVMSWLISTWSVRETACDLSVNHRTSFCSLDSQWPFVSVSKYPGVGHSDNHSALGTLWTLWLVRPASSERGSFCPLQCYTQICLGFGCLLGYCCMCDWERRYKYLCISIIIFVIVSSNQYCSQQVMCHDREQNKTNRVLSLHQQIFLPKV